MIGQTLGHYQIVEKIGEGGMGVVYRARDARLNRDVALKVLPAGTLADKEARKRFRNEALALSKLNHPNIATVYDFDAQEGVDFLVMEYLSGVTLAEKLKSGPVSEKEVIWLGAQVAAALEEAHECGVLHRDLKPENIAVTPKGQLKVLDFGLAKLLHPAGQMATTQTFTETQEGAGTLPYMSPEQLRGEPTDARSDIYAAGVVLFEMATSQRPFRDRLAARLTDAILHRAPSLPSTVNPRLSTAFDSIILKALDKNPEQRYQSAKELRIDLERLRAPAVIVTPPYIRAFSNGRMLVASLVLILALLSVLSYFVFRPPRTIDSIAVLPFANQTMDPNTDYLSDGIAETIINNLSEIPNLKVISRTSAFRYKGREIDPHVVGHELGVRAIVTGSVRQVGDAVSLTIELVDADDNRHLWGEQQNHKLADLFAMQEDIAKQITVNLRLKLTSGEKERLSKRYTSNAEAYQLYLKGRYFYDKRTSESWNRAHEFFEQAIQLDPNYALAWAGMADTTSAMGGPPSERRRRAQEAYQKALQLDDTLAEVHTVVGRSKLLDEWDWGTSQRELRRAIDLNPNYAEAHHSYSHYLMALGRVGESLHESQRALELDPLNLGMNAHLAWHYLMARQYDQAISQCHRTLEMDANYVLAHLFLAQAYVQKAKYQEAIIEFEKASAVSDNPVGFGSLAWEGQTYALANKKVEALKLIDRLAKFSPKRPLDLAMVYQGLGDKEMALMLLKEAVDERQQTEELVFLGIEPTFDSLHPDPRFKELLRRIGLPP